MMAASDAAAFLTYTTKALYLDDGEMAVIDPEGVTISSFVNGERKTKPVYEINWQPGEESKGAHRHYMHKEIHEQPDSCTNTMRGRMLPKEGLVKLGGLEEVADRLRGANNLIITSCGTSYYAALYGEYLLEEYAEIPVSCELSSEFRYRDAPMDEKTAVLAISQSGETIDTLEAVREAKRHGALSLGLVNVVGSTIARETDAGVYLHAGPEIGVASTKAFTSELVALNLLALFLGRQRRLSPSQAREILEGLEETPDLMRKVLAQEDKIVFLVDKYIEAENYLFLGRSYQYPIALEGALKLKEISYRHAEGYAAGEMKHGPIALVDPHFPTVALIPQSSTYEKMWNNIEEIKARRGTVIAVASQGDPQIATLADDVFYVPKIPEPLAPLLTVIPLQLFAYHLAERLNREIDQPRNLAKSVTVE
jgi:glucosamine--fructose-6-phosphate aminotransferase (isomerizing)